jgi:DNA-binding NarL/FixJ family response regulator
MQPQRKIKVMLGMDKTLFSQGMRLILERQQDVSLVENVENVAQLIEQFQKQNPDAVLMDLTFNGSDTAEDIKQLRERYPSAAVLIISNSTGSEEVYRALRAGVRGYISKDVDDVELVHAIRRIAAGRNYLSTAIATKLAERVNRSTLSEREMQVLHLIVKGKSNKEIADALKVTEPTIKYHVQSIMTKLGVTDRTEAATEALLRGIIRPQDL